MRDGEMVGEDEQHRGEIDDDSEDEEIIILVNVDEKDDEAPQLVTLDEELPNLALSSQTTLEKPSLPPVPVTILSGFLGSGKTTLIQYILQSPDHGKRIAVIENEFGGGDEGLSVETMIARDGANQDSLSDLIELPNGCICCTVKDSLVSTLENLLEKRSDLDYILIEASGMANPGPIASLFWLDDALESRLRLDGVVTLIDSLHIQQQLEQTEEAAQQVAYADRILLNKVDLVDSDAIDHIQQLVRTIHPTAPIRPTTYSQIPDLDWILDANCFDADRAKEIDLALSRVEEEKEHVHCTDNYCSTCAHSTTPHDPTHHHHTLAVGTIALVRKGSVSLTRMNAWLASLLWPNQDEQNSVLKARLEEAEPEPQTNFAETQIFRIKGILSVHHEESNVDEDHQEFVNEDGLDARRFIVQAVFDLWEIHPASDDLQWDCPINGEDGPIERCCKLVVIGRRLQEDKLREGFLSCFVGEGS